VPESQTAGAGDTYAAALALATAVGCDLADAADIAQAAADVAVQRVGTSVCTLADLRGARPHEDAVVADRTALRAVLDAERRAGRTVVFTNGCFDILHPGHTAYLAQAKALGDILVVAVNDDDSVRRLKGPERPVNTVDDRARVLAALHCVDYVIPFPESSPIALLSLLRPQLYVKGGDYTPEMLDETSVVLAYGGQVKTLGYFPTYSTTSVVERITHGRDPAA
jgi:rfaE bifunctional protein nucleotidyltransferase chain/domain